MGWTFTSSPGTSAGIKEDIRQTYDYQSGGVHQQVTDLTFSCPSHLWGVYRTDNVPESIVLFLLSRRKDSWGYKDITENMGPYDIDCPVRLLDVCPCPDVPSAREWRERVRSAVAEKGKRKKLAAELQVGDNIKLTRTGDVAVIEGFQLSNGKKAIRAWVAGRLYRIPPQRIECVLEHVKEGGI